MRATNIQRCLNTAVFLLFSSHLVSPLSAQIDAIVGEPFGVGQINVTLPKSAQPEPLGAEGLGLADAGGRVFYPVVKTPPDTTIVTDILLRSPLMTGGPVQREVAGLVQQLLKQPPRTTIYFLFRGNEPLDVTLDARQPLRIPLVPRNDPAAHALLLKLWWQQYTAGPSGLLKQNDYPPVVENYLKTMLGRRLGLALPERPATKPWQEQIEEQLGLVLGTEKVQTAIARQRMLEAGASGQAATLGLPVATEWPPLELPEAKPGAEVKEVKIETIAARVPAECLYVRFGSFANFLWMQDTLKRWGGDMSNLVALRGLDRGMSERMERQLLVKMTTLGRMLGGTLVSDVAMVGNDAFMREGPAFGLLFEARNAFLLSQEFSNQRAERLKENKGATQQTLTIADKKVSLISTPDGSARSYYLADGGYLFITTSRTLMERFIETGKGKDSLGKSAEFRHARTVMPLERDDTVFVYLSDAFFRNMAGPRYWIEMRRRLEATADIELVQMASLASATEGKPGGTIAELVAGGFLPPWFGPRPDGSAAVLDKGEVRDSVRGGRGHFTPIPDVPVDKITAAEAEAYRKFLDFYHAQWGRFDPMLIGIKRETLPERRERIVLDIHANPFARRHVEFVSQWIGPADQQRLAPVPGDLMAMEVQLTNQRLFGGLRDFGLPFEMTDGKMVPAGGFANVLVGYVGTTGSLGFLSLLDVGVAGPVDAEGFAGREPGLWRYREGDFTVFSLQREVLAQVRPQLRFEPTERPAQYRLHVGDVASARLTPALNTLGYLRTRETSLGNLRLMHALAQQLRVPGPDCRAAAELLVDAKLVCPLGGKYEYREQPGSPGRWTSTALEAGGSGGLLDVKVPEGYAAPPLNWFRGLDMEAVMAGHDLSAHIDLIMQLPPVEDGK